MVDKVCSGCTAGLRSRRTLSKAKPSENVLVKCVHELQHFQTPIHFLKPYFNVFMCAFFLIHIVLTGMTGATVLREEDFCFNVAENKHGFFFLHIGFSSSSPPKVSEAARDLTHLPF